MMTKKRIRSLIILTGILLISAACFIIYSTRDAGGLVVITFGGEVIQEMPLNMDGSFLAGSKESDYNLIVVEDGKAYVAEANCANADLFSVMGASKSNLCAKLGVAYQSTKV